MCVYEYTNNLAEIMIRNLTFVNGEVVHVYENKEGALRLAREYSHALNDFKVKHQDDIILESYTLLCCRYYQYNPPVIMSQWCSEVCMNLKK